MLQWTSQCEWAQSISTETVKQENMILCTQWPESERSGDISLNEKDLTLVTSEDYFTNGSKRLIPTDGAIVILGYTTNWLIGIVVSLFTFT